MARAARQSAPAPIREVESTVYMLTITEDEATDVMLGIVPPRVRLAVREMIAWELENPHKLKESA